MIGIVVGFIFFILVCHFNSFIFSKTQHQKIWIIISMFLSLVLGCIFLRLYSNQNIKELIICTYVCIPLILLDSLLEKK